MMSPSNGKHGDDTGARINDGNGNKNDHMLSMEMESLHPGATTVRRASQPPHPCSQLWMLIKLHIEYYPKIFSTVGLVALAFFMYMAVEWSRPALTRHSVTEDYSTIEMNYNFKASQIDHWCLFGGDSACKCSDFTEPVPREENKGWLSAHEANKNLMNPAFDYDVVFLGDDLVEEMNGNWYGLQRPQGDQIRDDFAQTFSTDAGGEMDGLALGIAGDGASNLMWRIKHGEMPDNLYSKVWWISIGSNDLATGGCSEEATILGILRVAEEVAFNNPESVVVIQGILPRSTNGSGKLETPSGKSHLPLFGKHHTKEWYADRARERQQIWPSIQNVNKELEDFCAAHGSIVYFDANDLFLGHVSNSKYRGKSAQIMPDLMPDYIHLGVDGHKLLHKTILDELRNIIFDENNENDIEEPDEP